MTKQTTPLEALADMARVLDGEDFVDGTSTHQKRALREAADGIRDAIEQTCGDLTPPILIAFFAGAATEATMSANANPMRKLLSAALGQTDSASPNNLLALLVAYLARDLLVGERVG